MLCYNLTKGFPPSDSSFKTVLKSEEMDEVKLKVHFKKLKSKAIEAFRSESLCAISEEEMALFKESLFKAYISQIAFINNADAKNCSSQLETMFVKLHNLIQRENGKSISIQEFVSEYDKELVLFEQGSKSAKKYEIFYQKHHEIFQFSKIIHENLLASYVTDHKNELDSQKKHWEKEYAILKELFDKTEEERKIEEQMGKKVKIENKEMKMELGLLSRRVTEFQNELHAVKDRNEQLENEMNVLTEKLSEKDHEKMTEIVEKEHEIELLKKEIAERESSKNEEILKKRQRRQRCCVM